MKIKILLSLLSCMLVLPAVPVRAESNAMIEPSDVHVIREDIPLEEALQDSTFLVDLALEEEPLLTRATSWEVWGEKKYSSDRTSAVPIGYSQHVSNNVVLSTYHYTRTYLDGGILGGKKGDSGRVWGNGTVKATGTYCMLDVWSNRTHTVKYGTED